MRKFLYLFAFGATSMMAVACASLSTPSQANAPQAVVVNYLGPRNDVIERDFGTQRSRRRQTFVVVIGAAPASHYVELTRAVLCDGPVSCRQAITHDILTMQAILLPDGRVKVSGVVKSKMGRHLSRDDQMGIAGAGGAQIHQEQTVSESIPVIGETSTEVPFEKILMRGEKLEVEGLVEARFSMVLQSGDQ